MRCVWRDGKGLRTLFQRDGPGIKSKPLGLTCWKECFRSSSRQGHSGSLFAHLRTRASIRRAVEACCLSVEASPRACLIGAGERKQPPVGCRSEASLHYAMTTMFSLICFIFVRVMGAFGKIPPEQQRPWPHLQPACIYVGLSQHQESTCRWLP